MFVEKELVWPQAISKAVVFQISSSIRDLISLWPLKVVVGASMIVVSIMET